MVDEKPKGAEQFDEKYWLAFRARARKRWSARGLVFVIGPWMIFIATLKFFEAFDDPPGDIRNAVEFRVLLYGGFIIFALTLMTSAFRWLRADARDQL